MSSPSRFSCGHENPDDNVFCDTCGIRSKPQCPQCGAFTRDGANYCGKCGHLLAPHDRSSERGAQIEAAIEAICVSATQGSDEPPPRPECPLCSRPIRVVYGESFEQQASEHLRTNHPYPSIPETARWASWLQTEQQAKMAAGVLSTGNVATTTPRGKSIVSSEGARVAPEIAEPSQASPAEAVGTGNSPSVTALAGIGGWLLVPAIGMPLGLAANLVMLPMSQGGIDTLVLGFWFLIYTFIVVSFFLRARYVPKVMITVLAAQPCFFILLAAIDPEFYLKRAMGSLVAASVLIPYWVNSKRVAATFTRTNVWAQLLDG